MGNKRRKDRDFLVGESTPGTTGESEGTIHDGQNSKNVDKSEDDVGEFVTEEEKREREGRNQRENPSDNSRDSLLVDEGKCIAEKYADKYSKYWTEEQKEQLRE